MKWIVTVYSQDDAFLGLGAATSSSAAKELADRVLLESPAVKVFIRNPAQNSYRFVRARDILRKRVP